MSSALYVVIMLGIMALISAVTLPAMLWKKCPNCRKRNDLDAEQCTECETPFPKD